MRQPLRRADAAGSLQGPEQEMYVCWDKRAGGRGDGKKAQNNQRSSQLQRSFDYQDESQHFNGPHPNADLSNVRMVVEVKFGSKLTEKVVAYFNL